MPIQMSKRSAETYKTDTFYLQSFHASTLVDLLLIVSKKLTYTEKRTIDQ